MNLMFIPLWVILFVITFNYLTFHTSWTSYIILEDNPIVFDDGVVWFIHAANIRTREEIYLSTWETPSLYFDHQFWPKEKPSMSYLRWVSI